MVGGFGVAPRMDTIKNMCLKEIGLRAQNTMTILGLTIDTIKGSETCTTIY